jgi:hypothetical protein
VYYLDGVEPWVACNTSADAEDEDEARNSGAAGELFSTCAVVN